MSTAPFENLAEFKARMSWPVPWYSSFGSDFNYDFHATQAEATSPVEYNYKDKATLEPDGDGWCTEGETAGLSVFLHQDGMVYT